MKKITYFILSITLCSCAGNPPAWWNPSGRYTTDTSIQIQPTPTSSQAATKPVTQITVPVAEETFTPEEISFEEMDLKPLANESLENAVEVLEPSVLND